MTQPFDTNDEPYRLLSELVPQLIWRTQADGKTDYFNSRWYDYTGQSVAESLNDGWMNALHPDDQARTNQVWYQAVETGQPYDIEYRLRRKDGIYLWFLARGVPVKDTSGQITAWFGTCTGIDEQKRAERDLEVLSEAGLLLTTSLDYAVLLDQLKTLLLPRLADWCVLTLVEEDGTYRRLIAGRSDDSPARQSLVKQLAESYPVPQPSDPSATSSLQQGQPVLINPVTTSILAAFLPNQTVLNIVEALGPRSLMIVPLPARNHLIGAITLVESRQEQPYKEADLRLVQELGRRLALALENARLYRQTQAALELRETFLNLAVHELRTPLTALKGWLQLAQRDLTGSPRQPFDPTRASQRLASALMQAGRSERLLDNMTQATDIADQRLTLIRQPLDLVQLLREIVLSEQAFQLTVGPVQLEIAPTSLSIEADRLKLSRALGNLLDNAFKFSPANSPVHIKLSTNLDKSASSAIIIIEDRGPGLSPQVRQQLFEPFNQAERDYRLRRYGGLGLGLYVSRAIIEAHGGQLRLLEPAQAAGTQVEVSLPLDVNNKMF